ncbi:manganese efflux pump [Candidatus Bathyarchaeota archaeon]|nr:manganese efflux pump [Candidatus Bathyarchaeota archaeon]
MSISTDPFSLILISIGLAMDAFSVALVAGFGLGKVELKDSLRISSVFGAAHILMPVLGWGLGSSIVNFIQEWDHWFAFTLLAFVGLKMLKEGIITNEEAVNVCDLLGFMSLLMFTVAVSLDALAVGLSFSLQGVNIWIPSIYMGFGTLIFSFIGLNIGNRTGQRFGSIAQVIGGLLLILIGLRVVLNHLNH